MIEYRRDVPISTEQFIEIYRESTLGERRPIDDVERMSAMKDNANLTITAWDGELLVGISRALTDFVYATYLSDLAVRVSHQHHGIGRELMRQTQAAAPKAAVILLAAPKAVDYYPKVGFTKHDSAWVLKSGDQLR